MKTKASSLRGLSLALTLILTHALWLMPGSITAYADDAVTKDSERIAHSFLMSKKAVRYQGYISYDRFSGSVNIGHIEGYFAMTPDGVFTKITINGVDLALPDGGLKAFPSNTKGKTANFYISANGFDADNQNVTFSEFSTQELKPGDPIAMITKPAWVRKYVPFTPPDGVLQENLRMVMNGRGWSIWYDASSKGFIVWVDPLDTKGYDYVITDASTGNKYQHGTLNPLGTSPESPKDSSVSFANIGGVVEIPFSDKLSGYESSGQVFDGLVMRDTPNGQEIPAKVFYADLSGGNLDIYDGGGLAVGSLIQVLEVNDQGGLDTIAFESVKMSNYRLSTYGIHGKVIVTVTGTLQEDAKGFGLIFYRQNGARVQSTTTTVPVPIPATP